MSRQREEEIRETVAETGVINRTIQEKDEEMAELREQAAEQKLAQRSQAAAPSRGAAGSREKPGAGDSPRSNMSSPWATDVSSLHLSFSTLDGPNSAALRVPNQSQS